MNPIQWVRQRLAPTRRPPDNANEELERREKATAAEIRRVEAEREETRRRLQIAKDLAKARRPD